MAGWRGQQAGVSNQNLLETLNFCRKIWYKGASQEGSHEIIERTNPRRYRVCTDVDRNGNNDFGIGILGQCVHPLTR